MATIKAGEFRIGKHRLSAYANAMFFLRLLALSLTLTWFAGCDSENTSTHNGNASQTTANAKTWFPLTIGDQEVRVQYALAPAEQQQGLMFRQELAENDGMLFVFPNAQQRSFWMQNVDIPLDVGYIAPDGVLREVYPMYPRNETHVLSESDNIQIVLEMNQGWFAKHDVFPGAKIDLAQVANAMKQRGFDPANYGLPE